jgi:hypothetical protein
MGVTSPVPVLAMVGIARAFPVPPFLPRELCLDVVKLIPSLVGAMGVSSSSEHRSALTAATAITTGIVGVR